MIARRRPLLLPACILVGTSGVLSEIQAGESWTRMVPLTAEPDLLLAEAAA